MSSPSACSGGNEPLWSFARPQYNKRMSSNSKFELSRVGFAVGFTVAAVCLYQLRAKGLDSPHVAIHWFLGLMAAVVFTVPVALAFYYYRPRRFDGNESKVDIEILAQYARDQVAQKSTHKTPRRQG